MTIDCDSGSLALLTGRPTSSPAEDLKERRVVAVEKIADQLQLIGETLDGVRTDLQWWTQNSRSEQQPEPNHPSLLPVYYPGDRVTVWQGRHQKTATVVDIDDADNTAGVVLEPNGDLTTVSQDELRLIDENATSVAEPTTDSANSLPPDSGRLF